ncbi:MAG: ACT domain-containing protein [Chloroflexota bacterium]
MTQTVEQALAAAKLFSDNQDYLFIQLPAKAIMAAAGVIAQVGEPFCALIVDKDEVSLVIPAEALADFKERLPNFQVSSQPYHLITFDIELDMGLVGFMAKISHILADSGVPIMTFAAYSRDHLLVPTEQFSIAMAALTKLQSGA